MSNELGSNEALGHLWQTQAQSRQVRAEVISVPVSAYVPPPVLDIEPRIVEARDAARVLEHQLPDVAMPQPTVANLDRTATTPERTARRVAQRDVQRRGDERRAADVRVRHDRATRTRVTKHAESSKAVRPDSFVQLPTPVPTTPTYDVRRPSSVRAVEASNAVKREAARTPPKARVAAVVEKKRVAASSSEPSGRVNVVA